MQERKTPEQGKMGAVEARPGQAIYAEYAKYGRSPEELNKAAKMIQRVARGMFGRRKFEKQKLLTVWNDLDWKEESELAATHEDYKLLKASIKVDPTVKDSFSLIPEKTFPMCQNLPVLEEGMPLTVDWVTQMMDEFKEGEQCHAIIVLLCAFKPKA